MPYLRLTLALWMLGCLSLHAEGPRVSEEAKAIHQSGMLFDGHNDLPWQIWQIGESSFEKMDIAKPQPKLHTDIPRLKTSGLKAQFWSVYVPAETDVTGDALLKTLGQIDLAHKMVKKYPDVFEMAQTADDVERIAKQGKVASMLGVEGGYSIENSLQNLKRFHDLGVRYMTLTHSRSLSWADSATDKPKSNGLSPFGEEVIREMNRLGMLVDLSHVSPETMKAALKVTKAPVIFSHSSARAICDHPRNVPDDVLRELPKNGGVVMINFFSGFIVPMDQQKQDPKARGAVSLVVDHIEHVIKTAGIDHVGIGSDYDGINRTPIGLEDVSCYPAITQELLDRGYDEKSIHKILGGNILRALREAEAVARDLQAQPKAE
jgi:membrane dipeptidase